MIDHEMHKIRIKAISDRIGHPMEYNDAGAPKMEMPRIGMEHAARAGQDERNLGKPMQRAFRKARKK